MTTTGLLISIGLFLVSLIGVGLPFFNQRRNLRVESLAQKERDELLTSYERVLATIRDLDEDHQTGKLAPETYQRERQYWTEQGIALLQQLEDDADFVEEPSSSKVDNADAVLDDAIERAITEYRKANV